MGELMSRQESREQVLVNTLSALAEINQDAYDSLLTQKIAGVFPVEMECKEDQIRLTSNVGTFPSAREYYHTLAGEKISLQRRQEFFVKTVGQLLQTVISCQRCFLDERVLSLNLDHIFVDPASEEVRLVLWPIFHPAEQRDIQHWFRQFPRELSGENADDDAIPASLGTEFLERYDSFFQTGEPFSARKLAHHLLKVSEVVGSQETAPEGRCILTEQERIFQLATEVNRRSRASVAHNKRSPLRQAEGERTLPSASSCHSNYPYIMREKTKEIVIVDKSPFRIGKKEQANDFHIADNPAISRTHAEIIHRNGRYFIRDKHSTNKTKVAGVPIVPDQETPLGETVAFRLANETFIFHGVDLGTNFSDAEGGTPPSSRLPAMERRSNHAHHDCISHRHRNDKTGQSG